MVVTVCEFEHNLYDVVSFSVGRVTEIAEEDTFLYESKVQEADRTVKRLGKGLKVREQSQQAFPLGLVP